MAMKVRVSMRPVVEPWDKLGLSGGGRMINVGHSVQIDDKTYVITSLVRERDGWSMELEPWP